VAACRRLRASHDGSGATLCTPKSPACALCPWSDACGAKARGDQESFPRKARKKTGTLRRGAAYVALRRDGFILLRARPAKGLLGGMTEVPTSAWDSPFRRGARARGCAAQRGLAARAGRRDAHFTHFPLELVVFIGRFDAHTTLPDGTFWTALDALDGTALPAFMRKVIRHAVG